VSPLRDFDDEFIGGWALVQYSNLTVIRFLGDFAIDISVKTAISRGTVLSEEAARMFVQQANYWIVDRPAAWKLFLSGTYKTKRTFAFTIGTSFSVHPASGK
jgi:hypothetical protein